MQIFHIKLTVMSTPGGVLYDQFQTYQRLPSHDINGTLYFYTATDGSIHEFSPSTLATAVITPVFDDGVEETNGKGPIISITPRQYKKRLFSKEQQAYLKPATPFSRDQSMTSGIFHDHESGEPIRVILRDFGLVWYPLYQGWLYKFDLIEVDQAGYVTIIDEGFYTHEHNLTHIPIFKIGNIAKIKRGAMYQPSDGSGVEIGNLVKAEHDSDVHVVDITYINNQWLYYLSLKDPKEGTEYGDLTNRLYAFESDLVSNRR